MKELVSAAKEINQVLGLIPRIRCFDDRDKLKQKILEVAEMVLRGKEMFSPETIETVKGLTEKKR